MITLVEALNYRCLRYIHQDLDPFHVVVGPNASGKTTFFDVIRFLGDLVSGDLESAVRARTENLRDLTWQRSGDGFELAVELGIREEHRRLLERPEYNTVRYEVGVVIDPSTEEYMISAERVLFLVRRQSTLVQRTLFPISVTPPASILSRIPSKGIKTIVNKVAGGNDNFYDETGKGWSPVFKLGPRKSALANLPEDESKFPVSTWLKRFLIEGVQTLVLNSLLMRLPSPPGRGTGFQMDGSNLPWVVDEFSKRYPQRKGEWVAHLRTALNDLEDIYTIRRTEDSHRYLVARYRGGLDAPSWVLSDGTLRLLALTLLGYLPDVRGVFLVEEPENGIHPRAVESMYQSLSSVYEAQVLLATHSPVILSMAEPRNVLCLAKTSEGATDIVRGDEHPALRDWRKETSLGVLYAAGVLG